MAYAATRRRGATTGKASYLPTLCLCDVRVLSYWPMRPVLIGCVVLPEAPEQVGRRPYGSLSWGISAVGDR
eukprot:2451814-Rhodomonas_salina.3